MSAVDKIIGQLQETVRNKDEYIEAIGKLLHKCNDIDQLDFIFRLLKKSQQV